MENKDKELYNKLEYILDDYGIGILIKPLARIDDITSILCGKDDNYYIAVFYDENKLICYTPLNDYFIIDYHKYDYKDLLRIVDESFNMALPMYEYLISYGIFTKIIQSINILG